MATSALAFATDTDTHDDDEEFTSPPAGRSPRGPRGLARRPGATEVARLFDAQQLLELRRMAVRLAGTSLDPDDLLHDALERALASLDRFEMGTNLHAWMRTIMFRLVVDRTRSRRRRKAKMEIERWATCACTPPADEMEEPAAWADLGVDDVLRATATLSEPLASTFKLFALDGLSYQEVAQRLGIPTQTVGTRVLRAKSKLRTVLTESSSRAAARKVVPMVFAARPVSSCASSSAQLAA
jgi:RNA polymerase sigma-70 factor, ECF subfamily